MVAEQLMDNSDAGRQYVLILFTDHLGLEDLGETLRAPRQTSALPGCTGPGPNPLERVVVDQDDAFLFHEVVGFLRGQESVVTDTHAPIAVDCLRVLVNDAGMHRPLVEKLNDTSVNVLLGVPVGLGAVWLAGECWRWWPLLAAVALPFVVEGIQALLPLGRLGFQLPDVIANTMGLVAGGVLGALVFGAVSWWRRWMRPASPADARPHR